ncbi:MAG: hypothetical protein ACHQNV_03485 [Vicinamibacteria bacterium]
MPVLFQREVDMARRSAVLVRALGIGIALLLPPVVAAAQTAHPPQGHSAPHGTDQTQPTHHEDDPFRELRFRELDLSGVRIDLLLMNDEACPVQVWPGPITRASTGQWIVGVDAKYLADGPLQNVVFAALVFDAAGTFKADRTAGTGGPLPARKKRRIGLALDRSSYDPGDHVVLAVREVTWADGRWHSVPEQVRMAAQDAVTEDTKP